MIEHTPSHLAIETFRKRIDMLLQLARFRPALVEAHRRPRWEMDPEALRGLAAVMHRFAPHSRDHACAYSCARALYRTAAQRSDDPRLRAESLADIGTSYFEEGRMRDAEDAFMASLSLAPGHATAQLGLLAIACARRDVDDIQGRCRELVAHLPDWHQRRELVATLATSPRYAFLRASPTLFFRGFGGYPEHLRALHDRHRLRGLELSLERFDDDDGDPFDDGLEDTQVVHRALHSMDPIVRGPACTLHGISAATLQGRLGL